MTLPARVFLWCVLGGTIAAWLAFEAISNTPRGGRGHQDIPPETAAMISAPVGVIVGGICGLRSGKKRRTR
jgi:hypothetical protein